MPDGVRRIRRANQRLAARGVGLREDQPRFTQAQQSLRGGEAEMLAWPVDASSWSSLQFENPADPNFGTNRFVHGLTPWGSTADPHG